MPPFLQQAWNHLQGFWTHRTQSQRVLIAGLAAALVLTFVLMIYWLNQPDMRVLYSNLFPEDASRVVEMLKKDNINYKLTNNGSTIMVPADQVYDLRLRAAGEGQVTGQGVGFEIFDNVKIGQTDFVQRINYQRALQGELSRTISEMPEVERARVHLVIPEKSLFIEEQSPPSASVMLKLTGDSTELEDDQIMAIVNLVAMSVENLDKSNITVSSATGQVLYQPEAEDSLQGLTTKQLDYRMNLQTNLERRIEQMLAPVVGAGRVIAKVNADVNFRQKTIRREIYDPDGQVVRSEQRSEESTRGTANVEAGVPEANFRGDGFNGSLSQQEGTRETRTINYEINKEEQQVLVSVGEVDRLSVSVLVDGTYTEPAEEGGEWVYVPRTEEELAKIENHVQKAVGYDSARGDSIVVSSYAFGKPDIFGEPTLMQTLMEYMQRLGKPFLNGILIFLFLVLIVRPVVLALIKPRVAEEEVEELISLPEAEDRLALDEGMEEDLLDLHERLEAAKHQAVALSEQDMEQAVNVLRNWLKQEASS
jgi:flagellar M-ring protein FliF